MDRSSTVFFDACDALAESKYIQSALKIKGFLSALSACEPMTAFLRTALRGFNFNRELKSCVVPINQFHASLKYPEEREKFLALIFTLLYKFDSQELNIAGFLSAYYFDDEGITRSYERFVGAVIPKFKRTVYMLLYGGEEERAPSAAAHTVRLSEMNELSRTISEAITYISAEVAFTLDEKEELLVLLSALSEHISAGVKNHIKAGYIGLRYTAARFPSCSKYVNMIYTCLKKDGII